MKAEIHPDYHMITVVMTDGPSGGSMRMNSNLAM